MLGQTLQSIAQADGSHGFHVVLAIEAREGPEGEAKARRLQERFVHRFARLMLTSHPADLTESHLDGSVDSEVPGKASNLKWALRQAHAGYRQEAADSVADVILTVADADVIFHPSYFRQIKEEFDALRAGPGSAHLWTMWQAPQLPFRNYREAPVCSRVWAYVSSVYEFGGVASLRYGGDHLVFSTYSMPLQLAVSAQAHEGDVIAEDHHAHLRCFFYSVRAAAMDALAESCPRAGAPALCLRPLLLPVKSTSVVSDRGCLQTWIDRWVQSKRHAQGVAELAYVMLAIHDMVRLLPARVWCRSRLLFPIARVVARMIYIHLVPSCQFVSMVALYACRAWNGRVPLCDQELGCSDRMLCGLAGAWNLAWPVAVPMVLMVVANVLFLSAYFLRPAAEEGSASIWDEEDGGLPHGACNRLALSMRVAVDCLVFGAPLVLPYGIVVQVLAFWRVLVRGNRFKYVTATKAMHSNGTVSEHSPLVAEPWPKGDRGPLGQ